MRTNEAIALFLFAHQDDEFGVLAQLEREIKAGRRVLCVYVTDGAAKAQAERRNAESLRVLTQLGVPQRNILFLGQVLRIADCHLHLSTPKFVQWLTAFIEQHPKIDTCFIPAWEGGHPDHDLLHAVAVHIFAQHHQLDSVKQYALYHGQGCLSPFFKVLSPLAANGAIEEHVIPWRDRLRYLRLCLSYPSQWQSWIGLFPFVFLRLILCGKQQLQPVSQARIMQRPHLGTLYYESRGFLAWEEVHCVVQKIISFDTVI